MPRTSLVNGEAVGVLLLDVDGGSVRLHFNPRDEEQERSRWSRKLDLDKMQRPLRWAVELSGSASIKVSKGEASSSCLTNDE